MAVPFYIPDEDETIASGDATQNTSTQNSPTNSPSRPIPVPLRSHNLQTPQQSPIDNEVLVQAFYEALCRCSQGLYFFYPTFSLCKIIFIVQERFSYCQEKKSCFTFYLEKLSRSMFLCCSLFTAQSVPHMSRQYLRH